MVTERVRMYSRQERVPGDVIAPEHEDVHRDLDRWGAWNRERYSPGSCASAEGHFEPEAWRETKGAAIALPPDPQLGRIDRVVRLMRMEMPAHGEAIRLYYVGEIPKREGRRHRTASRRPALRYFPCTPTTICCVLHMRFEDFEKFMFDCRSAVLNRLRRMCS